MGDTVGPLRMAIGAIARLVFWAGFSFIVANAVVQSAQDGEWGWVVAEIIAMPITFLVYPFVADPLALAWPLADGTSFIPVLVAAVVAYPISTVIGGLRPVG